jgi:hypothetical protein
MAKTDRIMAQWESFAGAVIPPNPAVNQARDMRRAFFAGAMAALGLLEALSRDDFSEEEGVEMLKAVHDECRAFTNRIRAGEF